MPTIGLTQLSGQAISELTFQGLSESGDSQVEWLEPRLPSGQWLFAEEQGTPSTVGERILSGRSTWPSMAKLGDRGTCSCAQPHPFYECVLTGQYQKHTELVGGHKAEDTGLTFRQSCVRLCLCRKLSVSVWMMHFTYFSLCFFIRKMVLIISPRSQGCDERLTLNNVSDMLHPHIRYSSKSKVAISYFS